MNIRTALVLLLEVILTLAIIYGVLWAIETYIAPIPRMIKITIAVVLVILFLLYLLGGAHMPLITW